MRGFHDRLRHMPSSLLLLLRCSSISMVSLITWSRYLDLVERMVFWGWCSLDPGLDGTAGLTDVDMTTLAWHAVHARSRESQVMLHRPKETGDLLWG
jgi:hypothetical protein